MTPRVKICGVTIAADALAVAAAGADYLGFNLWPGSKRHVPIAHAAGLSAVVRAAAPGLELVGVFVDAGPELITAAVAAIRLDVVQLHGDESPDDCAVIAATSGARVWKAIAVGRAADVEDLQRWPVDAILLDAPSAGRGGSGERFDWALARRAVAGNPGVKIILAGGLTAELLPAAIAAVSPWAVDVASGVEHSPGLKDHARIRAFVDAARGH